MRKLVVLFFAAIPVCLLSSAQTLFSYGKNSVDVKEFLRAYQKTQTTPAANKEKAMREYLQLYINSKLKVKEARARGYDTLAAFKEEIAALRSQIADNYMTDAATFDKLLDEAFDRSQKDIRVSHIFIPYRVENNTSDSLLAKENINKAYKELQSGKNFEDVALQFSKDPAVNVNKGDIGFITVFSLPYEFENIIYSLAAGKYTAPYKSSIGYHIFKKTAERKALGNMKAAQILFAIPPGSDEAAKNKLKALADSVYNELLNGADFGKMAKQFSNDYITAASDGMMPGFGIGTYDPVFETTVWGLQKNGDISKPFLTAHGYHIVKKIAVTPVPVSLKDKNVHDAFKSLLEKDPRVEQTREVLYKKVLAKSGYRPIAIDEKELWLFADSVLDYKPTNAVFKITRETPLFKLGDKIKTVGDFITYAQSNRYVAVAPGIKPHYLVMEDFKKQVAFDYYREHLESFNADFKNQMEDFKEGNLFFEIMMKEIWAPAQNDTAAQKEYYEKNKSRYQWKHSAAAVIFYCSDEQTAQLMLEEIRKEPANRAKIALNYGDRSTIDSGRFEIRNIPGMKNLAPQPGLLTGVEVNKDDNSAAFSYITRVYTTPAQKTFEEAKADVITDYQAALEAQWLTALKKKYPVKINEEVLKKIVK